MFGIDSAEFLVIAVVALVVIGPKDLPRVLYKLGQMTAKARAMSRHVRSGFDEMVRQAELEEMERKWAEQNRRIMADTTIPSLPEPAMSVPVDAVAEEGKSEALPLPIAGKSA